MHETGETTFICAKVACEILGFSVRHFNRLVQRPEFPKPHLFRSTQFDIPHHKWLRREILAFKGSKVFREREWLKEHHKGAYRKKLPARLPSMAIAAIPVP